MKTKVRKIKQASAGSKLKIAIVAAQFNDAVCEGLIEGAKRGLKEAGLDEKNISLFRVPGAFELPIICQTLAKKKKPDGIIALGAVIRGETAHFDFVCKAATDGLLRVGLDTGIPTGFGVITVDTLEQASARSKPDDYNKGLEVARAVLETIEVIRGM